MNAAAVGRAASLGEALSVLTRLRALAGHRFLDDTTSLVAPAIDLVRVAGYRQVTDAHPVNLEAAHDCRLATLDRGLADMLEADDRRHLLLLP